MRSDARRNYEHLLAVATEVIGEQGADASLRDIARRAGVVVGTLYRHFPTREALLDAVLRAEFDRLSDRAAELEATAESPGTALRIWMRECYEFTRAYQGVTAAMIIAMDDPASALHASCTALRAGGMRLLDRAQRDGVARRDIDGIDQFALVAGVAWLAAQPALADRGDHLFDVVLGAVMHEDASTAATAATAAPVSRRR